MPKFELDRYEDKASIELLNIHKSNCTECQAASSLKTACLECRKLHEEIVRDAQREKRREAVPGVGRFLGRAWYETIELADLSSEKSAIEFFEEAEYTRQAVAGVSLQGIDVSIWQGQFPWNEAVNAGISLGIAKCSEGNGYTDPRWGWNVSQLLVPGSIVGGSYHFSRPDLGNQAIAEAGWYMSRHPSSCFDPAIPWIFSLDAESNGGTAAWCYSFLDTVSSRIGYSSWFYSYANWIQSRGVKAYNRPLWLAWPNASSPPTMGWPVITMQQYGTRTFSVGQVDANEFFGDKSTLYNLGGVSAPVPQSPIPSTPTPPIKLLSRGQKVLAFRDDDRWDYVFIRKGELIRRWGNSISGMKDGLQLDNTTPWGESNEKNPGVKLIPDTEWVTWTPSGNYQVVGAQGTDGQEYYFWGTLAQGNTSGWQKIKDTIADLPLVSQPVYYPHKHTTTITETAVTDGGTPIEGVVNG